MDLGLREALQQGVVMDKQPASRGAGDCIVFDHGFPFEAEEIQVLVILGLKLKGTGRRK